MRINQKSARNRRDSSLLEIELDVHGSCLGVEHAKAAINRRHAKHLVWNTSRGCNGYSATLKGENRARSKVGPNERCMRWLSEGPSAGGADGAMVVAVWRQGQHEGVMVTNRGRLRCNAAWPVLT